MRRTNLAGTALALLAALSMAAACATDGAKPSGGKAAPAAPAKPEAVAAASEADAWTVELSGIRAAKLGSGWYEGLLAKLGVEKTVEKKGEKFVYRGLPLKYAVAMVDGDDAKEPFVFDEARWAAGYEVTLVAKDGYSATFSTKDLAPDALVIATLENGKPIPPMAVGDSAKNLWVRDLAAVETSLAPLPAASEAAAFRLELDINGAKASFSLSELEKSDLYLEEKGSYTTSAGTKYSGVYGGVRLRGLLERYARLAADDTVNFTAMDGYEMSYPGSLVLDEKDGVWILAFKLDGEYLPKDPGFVRTVKVGPGNPNIDGHLSVRMAKRIVVKQKGFKDFSLSMEGKAAWTLDRSTVQSCVSCHKKTVTFEKKGKTDSYTGFPAWLALAYVDDPKFAPHKQDKSFAVYDEAAAAKGYQVEFVAADGFVVAVDAKDLNRNDEVILAMYKNGEALPETEFPLTLVWDKDAKLVPASIKNARMIQAIKAKL